MKIKPKLVETVRIRKDRAELLKNKALALTIQTGVSVHESDIVAFLIDAGLDRVEIHNDKLILR